MTFCIQLNQNMEPDYENMNDRVMRLPIADELKQDMVDGITYCKKFSVIYALHETTTHLYNNINC